MIAQAYKEMLGAKSVIREISEWSTARGAEIGYDNVFDYSLGNPSVPCPASFTAACRDLLDNTDPVALHGYTPTLTLPEVRAAVEKGVNALNEMAGVLGLLRREADLVPEDVKALVEERQAAKKARDFAQADALRAQIEQMGYVVEDTPKGPKVRKA